MTDFVVIYLDLRTPRPVEAEFKIQGDSMQDARQRFHDIASRMNWSFLEIYEDDKSAWDYERLGNTETDELGHIFY